MTITPSSQENQVFSQETVQKNDAEFNFAQLRKKLEREQQARLQAEERLGRLEQERQAFDASRKSRQDDDDAPSDEPYVDEKRLDRKLAKFEERFEKKVDAKAEEKARSMIQAERQTNFLKQNADFSSILNEEMLQKFVEKYPDIAEPMLEMPDNFARQKLLYQNIKALGIHKKEEPRASIQDTINKNQRGAFYRPTDVASPPHAAAGDFSATGQKTAYSKMQELKNKLRL